MHDQRSANDASLPEQQDVAASVLDILIGEHPALLHIDELAWMYACGSIEHDRARPVVEDAVSELLASGLIHRVDRFVFASRAARRGAQLAR